MNWSKMIRAGVVMAGMGVAFVPLQLNAQAGAETAEQQQPGAVADTAADAAAADSAAAPTEAELRAARAKAISEQIAAVQQRALQDPELSAASQEINTLIQQTLPRVEPNYPTWAARAQSLQADVAAARAESDNDRLRELAAEAQQLQANVAAAQARAREDAAVKEKLDAYRVSLFRKMVELDPSVEQLVEELETLQAGGS